MCVVSYAISVTMSSYTVRLFIGDVLKQAVSRSVFGPFHVPVHVQDRQSERCLHKQT